MGLRSIPGVGRAVEGDLIALGYRLPGDLVGQDPEVLHARLCALQGGPVDRCMLYTLRCAIHFAENPGATGPLTLWWNWKDAADPPLDRLRCNRSARPGILEPWRT